MEKELETRSNEGLARRTFLKHAAAAAWSAPVIVTMMSRAAHAAPGDTCGTSVLATPGDPTSLTCINTTPCGTAGGVGICVPTVPGQPCVCT